MKKLLAIVFVMFAFTTVKAQQVSHTIQRGETLESIAQKYHVSVDALKQANPDAVDLFYVGMKLNIPTTSETSERNSQETNVTSVTSTPPIQNVVKTETESTRMKEEERKSAVYEIGYTAGTFDDIKASGSYGFGWTILPWNLVDNLYAGIHFSPLNFNFGLVDSDFTTNVIKLGPAIGYYLTPNIFVSMPVTALCTVSFKSINEDGKKESKTKLSWGMAWAPSIYVGKKVGIYVGPVFSMGFEGKTKVDCGFRAGFYF